MSLTVQTRQPKGIPSGGEFAGHDRAESDVALVGAPAKNWKTDRSLTDREILDQAIMLARSAGNKAGLSEQDIEDVAQETAYSVLKTRQNNPDAPISGGLLRVASKALVSRLVDNHLRHEDSKALTMWKRQAADREQELGRHLTATELDALADSIRDAWHNPRHKPRIGFQHEVRFASTEFMGAKFSEGFASPEQNVDSRRLREMADAVEDKMIDPKTVRLRVWNILSVDSGAPLARQDLLSTRQADAVKKNVGNAVETANAFLRGEANETQTEALFAPFGTTTPGQRLHAARVIAARPSVGDKLWRSAVDYAATRAA